jgi:hypothetical protein
MPTISAGTFVRFAATKGKSKHTLITKRLANGKWPGYRPRDDYWVRVRVALKRMLGRSDFTAKAVAGEAAKFQVSRRAEAAALLGNFCTNWTQLGGTVIKGRRLSLQLSDFTVNCAPHVTVQLGTRRLALRFGYSYSQLLTREDKVHIELLRLAIDKGGVVPGVLHVRSVMIATPRRDATTVAYIVAEARHLRSLWVANGGVL